MTEKAAGADATGMQTTAVRDGDNYVLNGEKWFSSARQRRRHRAGDGEDRSRRAAPPAVLDLPRRAAQPRLPDHAQHPDHGSPRGRARRAARRRPLRDPDQGPGGAGREPARRRGQRLRHGPAPPGVRPAAPRHAQRGDGAAGAGPGGQARHQPRRPSARSSPSARACSGCSPTARASSTSPA